MIWYSPKGEYIKEIGGWGDGPGEFNSPHAVTKTPDCWWWTSGVVRCIPT